METRLHSYETYLFKYLLPVMGIPWDGLRSLRHAFPATEPNNATFIWVGAVAWSLSTPFNESWTATNLLVWANGAGNGELDAIRFGNTWLDVTGVPEPGSAALTLLAGTFLAARRRRA